MDERLIYDGKATLEDLYELNALGYEFSINNGQVTEVVKVG